MILQWITLCLVRENPVFKTSQKKKKKKELIRNTCAGWFIILKYSTSVSKRSPQWSPGIVLCDSKRMWRGAVAPWALQDLPAGGRFGLPRCHTVPFLGPIFYLFIYLFCLDLPFAVNKGSIGFSVELAWFHWLLWGYTQCLTTTLQWLWFFVLVLFISILQSLE